jgi:hypothetical protein
MELRGTLMVTEQIENNTKINVEGLENNKKWCQLKKNQQICISNILRNQYMDFVLDKGRKPNKAEKEFIVACAYLEAGENKICISPNELRKYFESRLPKYDISIEKL